MDKRGIQKDGQVNPAQIVNNCGAQMAGIMSSVEGFTIHLTEKFSKRNDCE